MGRSAFFSAGLSGNILEWDLSTGCVKHTTDSYAGPVWSIATDPAGRYLAAACEDGLRLFGIADGTLQFAKAYSKAGKQRFLSVAWNKEGSLIYTGGADGFLRQWNVSSTSSTLVIKHAKIKGSFLWALTVLPDGMVVVGDSHGMVTLWDPNTATQVYSLKTHNADVLTLAYTTPSDDPSQIFIVASGPDSFLTCLRRINAAGPGGYRWTLGGKYRHHLRDVFALAISPTTQMIASGGADGSLHATELAVLLRDSDRSINTYPPLSPSSLVSFSAPSRRFLYRSSHSEMEVWRAGREVPGSLAAEEAQYPMAPGRPLPISEMPALLAKLQIKSGEKIISSALSPSGNTIACADTSGLKLFRLTQESPEAPLRVQKQDVQGLADGERMAWVAWMGDDFVVAGSFKGGVHVIDLLPSPKSIAFCAGDWTRASQPWKGAAAVSTNGKWIAASRYGGVIDVFQFDKSGEQPELSFRGSVPAAAEHSAVLALAFAPNSDVLVATRMGANKHTFSGADVLFFDVGRMAHATSYGKYKANMPLAAYHAIEFDSSNPTRFMFVSPSLLYIGHLNAKSHIKAKSFQWVLHAAFSSDGESLFVVERPQEFIDEKLTTPITHHKYGVA